MGNVVDDSFDIGSFKANFDNAAKNYLFYVLLDMPTLTGSLTARGSKFLVRSSTIPGKTVEKKEIGWQGYKFNFGGTTTHEDWTVTFMVDTNADIYKSFVAWSNMVHNPRTNVHGNPSDYMRDQRVQLLSLDGTNSIMDINLIGAWPTQIANLDLNYDNTDIATFQVTFAYIRHEIEGVN